MNDGNHYEFDELVDTEFKLVSKLGRLGEKKEEEDPDDELELYGTSPRIIVFILAAITLLLPVGGIGLQYNFSNIPPIVYGVLFVAPPEFMLIGFMYYIVHPLEFIQIIWITIPLCTFNFLFVMQINRWFYGKTSRDICLFYGILSVLTPSAITTVLWATMNFPYVITPLPFQFLAGVALLYKFRDPDYISPWKGDYLDWSWWARYRHSIREPNPEVINITRLLLQHDADWLEGWLDEDRGG